MEYQDCLRYLEKLGNEVLRMRAGLDTIRGLLEAMGNPHLGYPCVLVAGTNGKGSTARFISSISLSHGLLTGRFSSPHLVTVRERICLNETPVGRTAFTESFARVQAAVRAADLRRRPTYFEAVTATALDFFSRQQVDLAVLEVGLGGRLDSTNAVEPLLSVITPIGIDHQLHLGNTLEEIAAQKAGIIRPSRPVVTAPQRPRVAGVLRGVAEKKGAPLVILDPDEIVATHLEKGRYELRYRDIVARLGVVGRHQTMNAALAIESIKHFDPGGWKISGATIRKGLAAVQPCGVLHPVARNPDIFIDGGHNPDAARAVVSFLTAHTDKPRHLIVSMMKDKDLTTVSEILTPHFDQIDLVPLDSVRAASAAQLRSAFPNGTLVPDLLQALEAAREKAYSILVFGSFQLAGRVLTECSFPTVERNSTHSI